MSELQKITQEQMDAVGVVSAPDVLSGTPSENKSIFDKMVRQLIAPAYNQAIDAINAIEQTEGGIQAAEAERVEAEQGREEAEEARQQAEAERAEAEENRQNAETGYVQQAADSAELSESWAVGGTGIRTGEDTNNAKYWSQQAQHAAGGGVTSFKNRSGVVVPQEGDYTAYQIKTEDGGNVETALSNKVPIIHHVDTNVSLLDHSLSDGLHMYSNWGNCPPGLTDSQGICLAITYLHYEDLNQYWGRRIYLPTNDRDVYINECVVSTWTGWKQISTATPPQVRNLTLQSGFTANGDCTFFITQESVVFLAGGVSGTMPANQDTQIGTLPADARPSALCRRDMTTNAGAGYIEIRADGTVWAHPFAAASQCWFDCSFVAGGS